MEDNIQEEVILDELVYKEIDEKFPFTVFRNDQRETIFKIVKTYMDGKKFFVVEAPTGAGKSVIATTAMKVISSMFPEMREDLNTHEMLLKHFRSLVCTKTKALQHQYSDSFPDMPTLYSSTGYECNKYPGNPEAHYGSHLCDKKLCSFYNSCNYRVAQMHFNASDIGILNYAYFQHLVDYEVDLIALDEAHNLEKILCDHLHLNLNQDSIEKCLTKLMPYELCSEPFYNKICDGVTDIISIDESNPNWFQDFRKSVNDIIPYIYSISKKFDDIKDQIHKNLVYSGHDSNNVQARKDILYYGKQVVSLCRKLYGLLNSKVEWVISERSPKAIDIKPVELAEEANSLFSRGRFIILMSATISGIPEFCKNLGISSSDYEFVSLNSQVPVERRQVLPINLKGLSYTNRSEMLPIYTSVTDNIIEQCGKVRGLIHTVSYDNAKYIKEHSKHRKRMIIPEKQDLLDIKRLLDKKKDAILVTPSMIEGSDLSEDYCRFLIFFKIPFPFLGDKWIARKKQISNEWYLRETINSLIQGSGRGVRSTTDECMTFILDGNMANLLRSRHLFPKWYLAAIKTK